MNNPRLLYSVGTVLMFVMLPIIFIPGIWKNREIISVLMLLCYALGSLMIRRALTISGYAEIPNNPQSSLPRWVPIVGNIVGAVILAQVIYSLLQQ